MINPEMLKWALRLKQKLRRDAKFQAFKKEHDRREILLRALRHHCPLCGR